MIDDDEEEEDEEDDDEEEVVVDGDVVPAEVVTEAEGYKLHLSRKNKTGYSGVSLWSGFDVRTIQKYLGYFKTAVEAAAQAYARHMQELESGGGGRITMRRPQEVMDVVEEEGIVTEAEGLKLHLSRRRNSQTGYYCVSVIKGRFMARYGRGW